jgi:hypothetical protein
LLQIEQEILDLRDATNDDLELKPFGELNTKFETAFKNPELISRRYPVKFWEIT